MEEDVTRQTSVAAEPADAWRMLTEPAGMSEWLGDPLGHAGGLGQHPPRVGRLRGDAGLPCHVFFHRALRDRSATERLRYRSAQSTATRWLRSEERRVGK